MTEPIRVAHVLGHVAERLYDDPEKREALLLESFMREIASNESVMCGLIELEGIAEDLLNVETNKAARENLMHISNDLNYEQMQLYNDNANEEAFSFVNVEEGVYGLG